MAANLRLLNALPLIAGAREVETSSSPYRGSEIESAPTIGYGTTRIFRLPRSISAFEAVAFYRAKLHRSWVVVDVSAAPSLSLRKGDAYVHVLAGRGNVFVEVDHDCYKGGPFPRCFGP